MSRLDFTLPGFPDFELKPGGADVDVTIDNLGEYVRLVTDALLVGGVRAQLAAFRQGFSDVFLVSRLAPFTPSELDVLLNGARERWDKATVIELLKFDHGYTRSSAAISHLLDVIADLTDAQLASFLKFVTGSPRLPVGGLARLSPRLTIVQKKPESGVSPDAYLPSVRCSRDAAIPHLTPEAPKERATRTPAHTPLFPTPRPPPPLAGDDVRKLPQAARLLLQGGDARADPHGDQRGTGRLPPLVSKCAATAASLGSHFRYGIIMGIGGLALVERRLDPLGI